MSLVFYTNNIETNIQLNFFLRYIEQSLLSYLLPRRHKDTKMHEGVLIFIRKIIIDKILN